MPGKAQIQNGLTINFAGTTNGPDYNPTPTAFNAVVAGRNGPTPGMILVATNPGTDVNLSELTKFGGLCRIRNMDLQNFITIGIFDPSSGVHGKFYEIDEYLPGEFFTRRLSRNLQKDIAGTGTGTHPSGSTTLRIIADTAACRVLVEAFDP